MAYRLPRRRTQSGLPNDVNPTQSQTGGVEPAGAACAAGDRHTRGTSRSRSDGHASLQGKWRSVGRIGLVRGEGHGGDQAVQDVPLP